MITRILFVFGMALSCCAIAPGLALGAPAMTSTRAQAPATRWKANAALHDGMTRIQREVMGLEHYQHGHIGPKQAVILAGDIERDVGFVVSHCTLAPRADAALHPILAELMRGAQSIKSHPADLTAIPPMQRALQRYPVLFADPDWQAGI